MKGAVALGSRKEWDSGWKMSSERRWRKGESSGSSELLDEFSCLAGLGLTSPQWSGDHERPYTDVYNKHVCLAIYLKLETAVKT